MTFKYGVTVAPEQASHRPSLVKVTLLGKEALEVIQYPERTSEVWRAEGHVFLSEAGSEIATVRIAQGVENAGGLGATIDPAAAAIRVGSGPLSSGEEPDWAEFKEFDWVTSEMLKGRIELGGEKLLVYSDLEPEAQTPVAGTAAGNAGGKGRAPAPSQAAPKYPAGPLGGIPLQPGVRVAAIEESSKTPRYLQLGENIQIYVFAKPQQTKLELPAKIASLVAKPPPPPEGAKPISLIP